VVTKHDLLLDREVELGGVAVVTEQHTKWVKRLFADIFFFQEVVAPRLLAKVNDGFEMG
jgi:hypothetical protein